MNSKIAAGSMASLSACLPQSQIGRLPHNLAQDAGEAKTISPDVLIQNAEITTGKAGDLPQCMLVRSCQTTLSM